MHPIQMMPDHRACNCLTTAGANANSRNCRMCSHRRSRHRTCRRRSFAAVDRRLRESRPGRASTQSYVIEIRCSRRCPNKRRLLTNPLTIMCATESTTWYLGKTEKSLDLFKTWKQARVTLDYSWMMVICFLHRQTIDQVAGGVTCGVGADYLLITA